MTLQQTHRYENHVYLGNIIDQEMPEINFTLELINFVTFFFNCFFSVQDWNTFLLRFNELDFCISENETLKHSLNESITSESTVTSSQTRSSTQSPPLLEDPGPINISVPITLTLDPLRPFGGYSRNITHLYASVLGQQVGLAGMSLFFFSTCMCLLEIYLGCVLSDNIPPRGQ